MRLLLRLTSALLVRTPDEDEDEDDESDGTEEYVRRVKVRKNLTERFLF